MAAQMLLGSRKVAETILTEHLADIAALRSAAIEYWLSDGANTKEGTIFDAAKVQVALAAVTAFAPVAARHFDDKGLNQYSKMLRQLNRTVTGGTFETVDRKASPETAIEVARQSALLIHYLRDTRSSLYRLSPKWARNRYHKSEPTVRLATARLAKYGQEKAAKIRGNGDSKL